MKWTKPLSCLGRDLLLLIRDAKPSEAELLDWLGPSDHGRYHTLRKAGLLLVQDGTVLLCPEYCSADEKQFYYENCRFWIDEDRIDHFRSIEAEETSEESARKEEDSGVPGTN
jgi:hypothetical protein